MLDFVKTGLGIALVIEPIAASRRTLHTIAIAEPSFTWTIGVVAPPADQLAPAAQAFLHLIGAAAPGARNAPAPDAATVTP